MSYSASVTPPDVRDETGRLQLRGQVAEVAIEARKLRHAIGERVAGVRRARIPGGHAEARQVEERLHHPGAVGLADEAAVGLEQHVRQRDRLPEIGQHPAHRPIVTACGCLAERGGKGWRRRAPPSARRPLVRWRATFASEPNSVVRHAQLQHCKALGPRAFACGFRPAAERSAARERGHAASGAIGAGWELTRRAGCVARCVRHAVGWLLQRRAARRAEEPRIVFSDLYFADPADSPRDGHRYERAPAAAPPSCPRDHGTYPMGGPSSLGTGPRRPRTAASAEKHRKQGGRHRVRRSATEVQFASRLLVRRREGVG